MLVRGFRAVSTECSRYYPHPHSYPTRRSSDLTAASEGSLIFVMFGVILAQTGIFATSVTQMTPNITKDRKSTRLNSSHRCISYAVFCLKKKISYRVTGRPLVDQKYAHSHTLSP